MTHAFDIANGASLEDCHTNFFALADLTGLKWKRLSMDGVCMDVLEDPVLKSYSNCISVGILAVWRKVQPIRMDLQQSFQEIHNLSYVKELWLFWYGEEPDFSRLVYSPLYDVEVGAWENGLSYECRTLFFKALHNVIERCLLSRGYARLGKFFVEPQTLPATSENRQQVTFAFHFFVHGESTVCASIDVRMSPSVFVLEKRHMEVPTVGQKNVKVILSPHGMEGKLTGVGYKYNELNMARFLNQWHMFYPHPHGRSNWKMNMDINSIVEVVIGGVSMKYPVSYVFVTEEDHSEVFPTNSTAPFPTFALKSSTLPGLLTPPMSPVEVTSETSHSFPTKKEDHPFDHPSSLVLRSVIQDSFIAVSKEKRSMWNFQDPVWAETCTMCSKKQKSLTSRRLHRSLPFHRQPAEEIHLSDPPPVLPLLQTPLLKRGGDDLPMPTLSPQPPLLKEEDISQLTEKMTEEISPPFPSSPLNSVEVCHPPSCITYEEQDMEKPRLSKRTLEEMNEPPLTMTGCLYDYQHLSTHLWPCKRRSVEETDCDSVEDELLDDAVPSIPKDPYEFTEYEEPSEGFRPKSDILIKEERTCSSDEESMSKVPKFIREEDLFVSLDDLDNIFDTSSSSESDEKVEAEAVPSKLVPFDDISTKFELSRMYPTPPSLEHHAVPSPYGTTTTALEGDLNDPSLADIDLENVCVWHPPLLVEFIESKRYSAISSLLLSSTPPPNVMYSPQRHFPLDLAYSQKDYDMVPSQPPYSSGTPTYEDGPPDSEPPLESPPFLPLAATLLLSDSLLNVFKDHSFECCCLCSCNNDLNGTDAGTVLPTALIPTWSDDQRYKCTCGFSALVHRHRSCNAGLFYEDEMEACGNDSSSLNHSSEDTPPSFLLDLLRVQCKTLASPFSLFHKFTLSSPGEVSGIEMADGAEICYLALEEASDIYMTGKMDESLRTSCLHKWPYLCNPVPSGSGEVRVLLESLRPLLQVAIHRKNSRRLWEVTYVVSGPLTWKDFHRLAARGTFSCTEDQCEPQPIPSLLMMHDKDNISVSPFGLKYWDALNLEPYSLSRDVAYLVLTPDNPVLVTAIRDFFRDLSCSYEWHHLGRHRPITKVFKEGMMRIGKTAASDVADVSLSDWFDSIGESELANQLKLYARVCKHRLGPHLATLTLDCDLLTEPKKSTESTHVSVDVKPLSNKPEGPALVVYIVEPFTYGNADVGRLTSLALLHAYNDMLASLPEITRHALHLQILSLDAILCCPRDELKSLSLNVYSQSATVLTRPPHTPQSMTGFGPAAAQEKMLASKTSPSLYPFPVYQQPYILASVKDKQTELTEMFGDRREKCDVLYCTYCLTQDRRYIVACCTNDKGEFTETTLINIAVPNRSRRKAVSVRRYGLRKLLDFLVEVTTPCVRPWRLVVDRLGRLGHGELKAWASLLQRRSLQMQWRGSLLSACLVSLEPDAALRLMQHHITATCTHILVFPISPNARAEQAAQEPLDRADDLFGLPMESLEDELPIHDLQMDATLLQMHDTPTHNNKSESVLTENYDEVQISSQPLALGYYVSTASTGPMPKWFWTSCSHLQNNLPVFLKSALLITLPSIQQNSDELLQNNAIQPTCHPLDSTVTTDVLRYVLEGYNALSWLQLDSDFRDRRSCLPLHMQVLVQLYGIVETLL